MFGVDLTGQVHELILVPHGFQLDQILGVQQRVSAIRSLMKEIVRDQYRADIPVMAAFREQVAHRLRKDVVQQIVKGHEARSVLCVAKFLVDALVVTDVFPQFAREPPLSRYSIRFRRRQNGVRCTEIGSSAGSGCRKTT